MFQTRTQKTTDWTFANFAIYNILWRSTSLFPQKTEVLPQMKLQDVQDFYQQEGEKMSLADSVTVTNRDPQLAQLERECILQYISADSSILDIGCGDASHTVYYAARAKEAWGLEPVESLLALARQRREMNSIQNLTLVRGNALEASTFFAESSIDLVITQRCLINLEQWKHQKEALQQIASILEPGGLYVMIEGFMDELRELNSIRQAVGLSEIKVVPQNHFFENAEFEPFITECFTIENKHDFGFYMFQSRVYHPLVIAPEQPKHDAILNRVAQELSPHVSVTGFEKYSYDRCYVLRRK
jgi:ubiquinone/menaquinone biosynthesis C-methylase UbiE